MGLCMYVRNVGLFKIFAYSAYKRKFKQMDPGDHSAKPMSMTEFAIEYVSNPRPMKEFFIVGIPCWAVVVLVTVIRYRI